MRILIAEDEPISLKVLADMMQAYGEVVTTSDGGEAYDAFLEAIDNNEPFDIILLDIQMPNFNGQETLHAIREYEEERFIPESEAARIIMTSSLSDGENIYEAHMNGCTNYLLKPISRETIKKTLVQMHIEPNS